MPATAVESSMIAAVEYHPEDETLDVHFHSGHAYRYHEVEPEVYEGLMEAESKGRYFLGSIRDFYHYDRLK